MSRGNAGRGITIIIPAYNAAATLPVQLNALLAQAEPSRHEILVVDNGSTDGTTALVRAKSAQHPHLRLVDGSQRLGANHARNVGASAASYDKLLFCDADDVVAPGWIDLMGGGLDRAEGAGGRIDLVALNDTAVLRWRREASDPNSTLIAAFLTRPIGANCGVRRSVWTQLGGFDEAFMFSGDDTDFFWRLQLAGYEWTYVEAAVVHYRLRPGLVALARDSYRYGRTRPQLYQKFRSQGMPPARSRGVLGSWWRLATSAPGLLMTDRGRGTLVRELSYACGKVAGSVKYRSWYL